uniref:Uncharacterized protein n=1 Tax=Trichuris muris TaxID=70415 RepID=A0A5S6QH17_TRIMR
MLSARTSGFANLTTGCLVVVHGGWPEDERYFAPQVANCSPANGQPVGNVSPAKGETDRWKLEQKTPIIPAPLEQDSWNLKSACLHRCTACEPLMIMNKQCVSYVTAAKRSPSLLSDHAGSVPAIRPVAKQEPTPTFE